MSEEAAASERALVTRYLRARDEHAFRELYRAGSPPIYGFLMRLTGKPEEAQELLQETWARAAAKLAASVDRQNRPLIYT